MKHRFTQWRLGHRGFTLIELLVVVAVMMVLLAGVISLAGSGSQIRSRNAKRKADLEQIRSMLERYRGNNNRYPTTLGLLGATLPRDPQVPGSDYPYGALPTNGGCSDGLPPAVPCTGYVICTTIEGQTDIIGVPMPNVPATCNYFLRNP